MLCPTYVVNFYKRYPLIILRPATIRIVIPEAYPQPDNNKNPINNNEITFFFFFFSFYELSQLRFCFPQFCCNLLIHICKL